MTSHCEDLTTCNVCLEKFSDPERPPRLLMCNHTFCGLCINRIKSKTRIKCPKCNHISSVGKITADFRLASFMDALKEQAQQLSAQAAIEFEKEGLPNSYKCELCEEHPIDHRCLECKQWMCNGCKRIHEKSKSSQDHKVESIEVCSAATKGKLQKEAGDIVDTIRRYEDAILMCETGIHRVNGVQTKTLQQSMKTRQKCHTEINTCFDTIDTRIRQMTHQAVGDIETQLVKVRADLFTIQQKRAELAQIIANDARKLVIDGDKILREARIYVESLGKPEVSYSIPDFKVQRMKNWEAYEAAKIFVASELRYSLSENGDAPVASTSKEIDPVV